MIERGKCENLKYNLRHVQSTIVYFYGISLKSVKKFGIVNSFLYIRYIKIKRNTNI